MNPLRRHPLLFEENPYLRDPDSHRRPPLTLSQISLRRIEDTAQRYDLLWLMGVWKRSEAARQAALCDQNLRRAYDEALPGWTDDDVAASPYAVAAYELDPQFGRPHELRDFHERLNAAGGRLILDFVPNHLAMDHPRTATHPQRFVNFPEHLRDGREREFFVTSAGHALAHGRDPHFPPWRDTVQVNFFSRDLREAFIETLFGIAEVADGVRCDMAMLGLNEVFERTWGWALGDQERPQTEFWSEAIERVREKRPDFLFIAEAYWGLEGRLIELGFDYTYDKHLYDALRWHDAAKVREVIASAGSLLERGVHFIENHDEERAATAFGKRHRAAAVVIMTLPGMRMVHRCQEFGWPTRIPVQLVRHPEEISDRKLFSFYHRLELVAHDPVLQEGAWRILPVAPVDGDVAAAERILAWSWERGGAVRAIVINYSGAEARGLLTLPSDLDVAHLRRADLTADPDHASDDSLHPLPSSCIDGSGLRVKLSAWSAHLYNTADHLRPH